MSALKREIMVGSLVNIEGEAIPCVVRRIFPDRQVVVVRPGKEVRGILEQCTLVEIPKAVTCTECGRWWKQRGNRTGHCSRCHQTFEGLHLFDSHFVRTADASTVCRDPARLRVRGNRLRLLNGTWWTQEKQKAGTFG